MKKTRILAAFLALAMIFLLTAGCSSNEVTPEESDATQETAATEQIAKAEESPAAADSTSPEESPADTPEDELQSEAANVVSLYRLNEPVTYTMWMGLSQYASNYVEDPTKEITLFREISERLDVSFDLTTVNPDTMTESFNLMIAGGEYCDIISNMNNYSLGIEDAIENEIIRDVYDLVKNNAPNYWNKLTANAGSYLSQVTESGYLGTLCVFRTEESAKGDQYGYLTNGDWYEEFGMEIADTMDEFHDYLVMANQTYGAQFSIDSVGAEAGLLSAYNIAAQMYVVDGDVRFGYVQDEMFEYFTLLNQWYSEGIIESDFYSGATNTGDRLAGTANGTFSAWAGTAELSFIVKNFVDEGETLTVVGTPYMKFNEDDEIHTLTSVSYIQSQGSAAWAFRYDLPDEDVLNLLNVVEYLFTDEGYILFNFGVEGEGLEYDEAGNAGFSELVINNSSGMMYNAASYIYASHNSTTCFPAVIDLTKSFYGFVDNNWECLETFTTMGDDAYSMPGAVSLTTEESEAYNAHYTDVSTFIEETVVEWIIGKPVTKEQWESFKETLYSLGLSEMIDVQQQAYDRYLGRVAEM